MSVNSEKIEELSVLNEFKVFLNNYDFVGWFCGLISS